MDTYPRGDVAAFVLAPLLVMTPPPMLAFVGTIVMWLACTCNFLGWRIAAWDSGR